MSVSVGQTFLSARMPLPLQEAPFESGRHTAHHLPAAERQQKVAWGVSPREETLTSRAPGQTPTNLEVFSLPSAPSVVQIRPPQSSFSGSSRMSFSPAAFFSSYFFTQVSQLFPAAVSRPVNASAAT